MSEHDSVFSGGAFDNAQNFRETVLHGTPRFPMQIYKNDFSWYVNHMIDWHWHPELEIAVVLSGKVHCYINDMCMTVSEGEGFFINANMMHKEIPATDGEYPTMTTVCFLPDFIGDCGSDIIFRKYIMPVVSDTSLRGIKLSPDVFWQSEIIDIVKEMFSRSEDMGWGYELRYRNMLSNLWYILAENLRKDAGNVAVSRKSAVNENRLKEMLTFIHSNYQRDLSIEEISRSANISKSECFRCFASMIDKKPVTYLNEYRLKQAVNLLITTDMPVTQICFACGFNHISYFGKLFRRYYGMTPKEYRNNSACDEQK